MTELSQTVRRRPAPLPTVYRPMADTITGGRSVVLSTDPASRRALRSVGKVAATTGDTIHLDPVAVPARRIDEVIAHELTHVAHPSPTPRFFDDVDDSPEERRAEQVARIMARAPLAPSASVVAPTGRRPAGRPDVGRRSAVAHRRATTTNTPPPGTLDANALAARLTGGSTPRPAGTIRRSPAPAAPTAPIDPAGAPVIRRLLESPRTLGSPPTAESSSSAESRGGDGTAITADAFLELFRDNLSEVMSLIEDRIVIELERRGGRTWGAL
jgi:hypothetical protein